MQVDADSFRALARSSPWRWRTLHLTRHGGLGEVEAWVRRPGDLVVRPAGRPEEYVHGVPYGLSAVLTAAGEGPDVDPVVSREVLFRADGLVEQRPDGWHLEHGDPMWESYSWTAMLDPEELSHHVEITDPRSDRLRGRETWRARLRPLDGYEPRCGCCALLWSEISVRAEYGDEPDRLARFTAESFPEAYDVALDEQTGVLVELTPVGGSGSVRAFSVEIHEVDADVGAVLAGHVPTR